MQGPPTVTRSDSALGDPGGKKRPRLSFADDGDHASSSVRADYFPAAFQHMFGPLPMPPVSVPSGTGTEDPGFPLNVTFRTADWAEHAIPEDEDGWDVVLA
jgi:7SK snRNA methylphosphate capping enzyme